MKVIITDHARRRLRDYRQEKITTTDIIHGLRQIPGQIPKATRLRGFISRSGRIYDIVVKDIPEGRLVITIIGK